MANELIFNYPTGGTLYALLFDSTGQIYNGSTFAAPGSANWTSYDIAMTEVSTSTGIYRATMPAVAAGVYTFVVRKQAGGSPAVGDVVVGSGQIQWDGTAELSLAALPDAQDIRDAMLLTVSPGGGDVIETSVDGYLMAILADTGTTLPATLAALPASTWSYTTRTLTQSSTSLTDSTVAGAISRRRGDSWSISLTLGAITGYTSLWFTIKRSYDDADTAAIVQIKLNNPSANDGLLYINGVSSTVSIGLSGPTLGSITVNNATTGAITVALDETVTDDLAPGTYYYDAQALISGSISTPDSGTFTITADVTRVVV